jgi:hypothetical protein
VLAPSHDIEIFGAIERCRVAFWEIGNRNKVPIGGELVSDAILMSVIWPLATKNAHTCLQLDIDKIMVNKIREYQVIAICLSSGNKN